MNLDNRLETKLYIYFTICLLLMLFTTDLNPFIQIEANHVIADKTPSLKEEIKKKSSTYQLKAEDAYIDRVWKKTPGRNGRKVNIEKSYQKMKKDGVFEASLLVYDEISPEISLKDLPPAPIFRGHPEKEMVALMINVSWGTEYIPAILKILKEENVKATFYIEGQWAKNNKEFVEMIQEESHLIGNHAYNHPDMAKISDDDIQTQIKKTNDVIHAITGESPVWFAPPSGSYNQRVVEIADSLKMETILWTVDTIDWQNPSVSVMINRVMENIHPGATVLMHPTEVIAEGLDQLIIQIKEQGYELGTIEKLLSEERG